MTRPATGRAPARRARPGPRQRAAADPVAVGDLARRLRDAQRALRPRLRHPFRARAHCPVHACHARPPARRGVPRLVGADLVARLDLGRRDHRRRRPARRPRAARAARKPRLDGAGRRAGGWCTAARTSAAPTCATTRGWRRPRAAAPWPPSASSCAAASRPSARSSASIAGRPSPSRRSAPASARPGPRW